MAGRQLRLVTDEPAVATSDDVRRLFDHWVFMLGKNPKRVALGPERRKVITRALQLYDVDVLEMAIEGCAASEWHAGENDRGASYQDIELILRNEAHVERFAALGERLRIRVANDAARARAQASAPVPPHDAAAAEEHRQRMFAMAKRMRGGA